MSDRDLLTKLDFARLSGRIYGRDDEISAIRSAYLRVSGSSSSSGADQPQDGDDSTLRSSEAVFVSGPSGVGKSHLVESALSSCCDDDHRRSSWWELERRPASFSMAPKEASSCWATRKCRSCGGGTTGSLGGMGHSPSREGGERRLHFLARGEFDESGCAGPYSGIVSAFQRLCEQFRDAALDDPTLGEGVRRAVSELTGESSNSCEVVAALVPEVRALLRTTAEEEESERGSDGLGGKCEEEQDEDNNEDNQQEGLTSSEERVSINLEIQARFNFTFRAFVRALCSQSDIIVLVLDGLQWADVSSIDLIRTLMTDPESTNLLLIGNIRGDTKTGLGHLEALMRDGSGNGGSDAMMMRMTHIPITNFDHGTTNLLVSNLLRLDADTTSPLSEIVHQRTDGNAFYLRQFLETMQEEGLLHFSFQTLSWEWADADVIRSTMTLSENVVDMMLNRLRRLPPLARCALGLASFLGSRFSLDLLEAVAAAMQQMMSSSSSEDKDKDKDGSEDSNGRADDTVMMALSPLEQTTHGDGAPPLRLALRSAVETAMSNGILEIAEVGGDTKMYRFTDDQLKRIASSSLFPPGPQRDILHACIGEILWEQLIASGTVGNYDLLFTTVNHLNRALHSVEKEPRQVSLAKINLKAGQIAAASSAFIPAAEYFAIGKKLLSFDGAWDRHYDLCIDVFMASAKTDSCLGRYDESNRTVDQVSAMARSPADRVQALLVNIDSLRNRGDLKDAIEEGVTVLSLLGIKFPRRARPHTCILDLLKTKRMTRNLTNEDVASLPIMRDKTKLAAMEALEKMFRSAVLLQSDFLPLITCRMVRMTIKHGISRSSSAGAFASYAMITCGALHEIKKGYEFGRMALSVQEDVGDEESLSFVLVIFHNTVAFWRDQMQLCLEPLLEAYKLGMRCGDTGNAMMGAIMYSAYYFFNGLPLAPLEKDMSRYRLLMIDYKTQNTLDMIVPLWQYVRKLMGLSDNPRILSGDVFSEEEMNSFTMDAKGRVAFYGMWGWQMELAFLFDDMEAAVIYAAKTRPFRKLVMHYVMARHTFIDALSCFAMARTTKKRKWQTRARKMMRTIEMWVSRGGGNFLHVLLLLKAEDAAFREKDVRDLKRKYDDAISVAARLGYKQDEAIANERAGAAMLMKKDDYWASYYLSNSCRIYSEWGARAKAAHVREKCSALFESERASTTCFSDEIRSSHRGRERYTDEAALHSRTNFKY